jgi:hypothetical protein
MEIKLPEIHVPAGTMEFVQRVLGPLAEAADFLSDKIRFYRWKSSLDVMDRAAKIAHERGIDPKEVPLKIFVPLLEKASLEQEQSPLIERWATLLAQASADPESVQAVYIDILSKLSAPDVQTLEMIVPIAWEQKLKFDINSPDLDVIIGLTATQDATYETVRGLLLKDFKGVDKQKCYAELQKFSEWACDLDEGVSLENFGISFHTFDSDDIFRTNPKFVTPISLDVLASAGLVVRRLFRFDMGLGDAYMTLVVPTLLGVRFVSVCRGDQLPAKG